MPGWCVTVKGRCPLLLKSHLVVGTILITSVEELLDDLYLPPSETRTSLVVRTACSNGESPLVSKCLVLLAGKLGTVVINDFCWSASTEKQTLRVEITSSEEMLEISVHKEICCSNQQSKGNICYLKQICPYLILSKVCLVPQ